MNLNGKITLFFRISLFSYILLPLLNDDLGNEVFHMILQLLLLEI